MKDGHFAGHINRTLADEIFEMRSRITEVFTRKNPGWKVVIYLKLWYDGVFSLIAASFSFLKRHRLQI